MNAIAATVIQGFDLKLEFIFMNGLPVAIWTTNQFESILFSEFVNLS